jgi:cysteinyl-tRNA synthetase
MNRAALFALAFLLPACNVLALNSAATTTASTGPATATTPSPLLSGIDYFAIVLQNVGQNGAVDDANITQISQSHYDMVVIDDDTTWNGASTAKLPAPSIVSQMHNTPGLDVARKVVLAYVDIGEAESSRTYWQSWTVGNPSFVLAADPNPNPYGFLGKFVVNFTDPHWQSIVYGSPTSLIDQAITDGFDGVFLDNVGSFAYSQVLSTDHNAANDMVSFVSAISTYAKTKKSNFVIVACGGAGLTTSSTYISAIDGDAETGIAFTSTTTPGSGDVPQDPGVKATFEALLQRVSSASKSVLSIDFATNALNVSQAYGGGSANRYLEYVTTSDLSKLTATPPQALGGASRSRRVL